MRLDYTDIEIPEWLHKRGNEMLQREVQLQHRFIHVTQMLQPAHQLRLLEDYQDFVTQDPNDLIPAMIGVAWHKYMEGVMSSGLSEQSIEYMHGEWAIKGTPDFFNHDVLIDFKTTKTWSRIYGKDEWEQQLNIYRWLVDKALMINIPKLEVHAIYLDWTENGLKRNSDHPKRRWEVIDIPVWELDETEAFIDKRLEAILNPPKECSPGERWERNECWAVMKEGRKKAMSLCDSEQEASDWIIEKIKESRVEAYYVEHRKGDPVRCRSWCPVKEFCQFGQKLESAGK